MRASLRELGKWPLSVSIIPNLPARRAKLLQAPDQALRTKALLLRARTAAQKAGKLQNPSHPGASAKIWTKLRLREQTIFAVSRGLQNLFGDTSQAISRLSNGAIKRLTRLRSSAPAYSPAPFMSREPKTRLSRAGILEASFWVCLGLVVTFGAVILVLMTQIRELGTDLSGSRRDIASLRQQISAVQKQAQAAQQIRIDSVPPTRTAPTPKLVLDDGEAKLLRQYIRTPPPKPGAEGTIHLGNSASAFPSAPIPEPLAERVPKLAGARFSVDRDGSIVIVASGSNNADLIIER